MRVDPGIGAGRSLAHIFLEAAVVRVSLWTWFRVDVDDRAVDPWGGKWANDQSDRRHIGVRVRVSHTYALGLQAGDVYIGQVTWSRESPVVV